MNASYFLYKIAGAFLTPPGILIVLCFTAGLLSLFRTDEKRRRFRSPSLFFFSISMILYVFSIPCIAKITLSPLEEGFPFEVPEPEGKTVVLVLAGGIWSMDDKDNQFAMSAETLQRFVAGVALSRKSGYPLLFSGGYPEKASLEQINYMVRRTAEDVGFSGILLVEGASRTTWENLLFSSKIISTEGFEDVILVTSGFHLKRSLRAARHILQNVRIHPFPSGRLEGGGAGTIIDYLPSPSAMRNTSLALRELFGLFAYNFFALFK